MRPDLQQRHGQRRGAWPVVVAQLPLRHERQDVGHCPHPLRPPGVNLMYLRFGRKFF
jgi:hypothetical protein